MTRSVAEGVTRVEVAVSPPYDVLVGAGLLDGVASFVDEPTVAVVSETNVAPLYSERVCERLKAADKRVVYAEVPAGEGSKSLSTFEGLLREFAARGLRRDSAVLALGGGVVSDLAGFAAATYHRGVAFYSCPTSLLAMVDASVGGKTGVNLPEGKNLVGAFWQPRAVVADVTTLATLSPPVFREGAVELYKHGLIDDEFLLTAPDEPEFRPGGDSAILSDYIARSISVKAKVVSADERESGKRAYLNLGHTLGHALEAVSRNRLPHGEAVAYGLLFAALLGAGRGWYDFTPHSLRLLQWLRPSPLPTGDFAELLPFMLRDKKNSNEGQRFVLLRDQATPIVVEDVSVPEQRAAWDRLLEVTS